MSKKFKVIIRRCEDYSSSDRIRGIIREGMEELGEKPRGRVLVKPNGFIAHHRYIRHAFTRPEFLQALLGEVSARDEVDKVTLGERGIYTCPTRYVFREAGWTPLKRIPKVKFSYFDEEPLVTVKLTKSTVHQEIHLARPLVEADYKIYAPKLKHHATTRLTCALKLNIGILDRADRTFRHDWRLEEKIADLYEAGYPNLVVVDGIIAGQQHEVSPTPLNLGVIIIAPNSVAADSVAARILGFASDEVKHLQIARARGWEPVHDEQIDLVGDVTLEDLQAKTRNLDRTFHDLLKLDTPIRFFLGNYPDGKEPCHGGCVGTFKTMLAGFESYDPGALKRARPVAMVIGEYQGDVDGQGGAVMLVGDCTKVSGKVQGKIHRVPGCLADPYKASRTTASCSGMKNPLLDPWLLSQMPALFAWSWIRKISARKLGIW